MAINGPTTQMFTGNPTLSSISSKRKTAVRKSPPPAGRLPAVRKPSTEPTEILYKDLPNPFQPSEPPYIWIDFPQQKERLLGPTYVVRLGAGGAEAVEISIDKGAWTACRLTSGYWWYDWSNIPPGKHTLAARMRTADGRWFRTPPRSCEYRP